MAAPEVGQTGEVTTVEGTITVPGREPWPVWFELPPLDVTQEQAADAMFAIGTVTALRLGHPLHMTAPVSPWLLHSAKTLQNIYELWHPQLRAVPIHADSREATDAQPMESGARDLATCFSGGVDSLHSVLSAPGTLRYGLYVQGYDIGIRHEHYLATVVKRLQQTADGLGVEMLHVRTNLLEHTRGVVEWGSFLHGAALSAVGMLLAQRVHTLLIPSSGASRFIQASNGSHHATDGLHDTKYFSTEHHGTFVGRGQKTAVVAANPVALEGLRVCYRSRRLFNCGVCHKCLRTQLELEVIGARTESIPDFEVRPTRAQLLQMVSVRSDTSHRILTSTRAFAEQHGADDIVAGLDRHLARYEFRRARQQLVAAMPGASPDQLLRLRRRLTQAAAAAREAGVDTDSERDRLPRYLRQEKRRSRGTAQPRRRRRSGSE